MSRMKNVRATDVLGIEEGGGEGARLKRHKKDIVGGSENSLTNCSLYVEI